MSLHLKTELGLLSAERHVGSWTDPGQIAVSAVLVGAVIYMYRYCRTQVRELSQEETQEAMPYAENSVSTESADRAA